MHVAVSSVMAVVVAALDIIAVRFLGVEVVYGRFVGRHLVICAKRPLSKTGSVYTQVSTSPSCHVVLEFGLLPTHRALSLSLWLCNGATYVM